MLPSPEDRLAQSAQLRTCLALLLEALEYAEEVQADPWDFAVELRSLLEGGCSRSAVRWLICQGYASQALESVQKQTGTRSFQRVTGLALREDACFVLTASGLAMARTVVARREENGQPKEEHVLPCWDGELRELHFGGVLVKRFTQPAVNQETILAAFQEEGWPRRIDNPLPPRGDLDAAQRLHDGVQRLNRHQRQQLLRFHCDGNGQGVRWESGTAVSGERR